MKNQIDYYCLPDIPGWDKEAQRSIVKYLITGEADMWEFWHGIPNESIMVDRLGGYKPGRQAFSTVEGYTYSNARPVKQFDTMQGKITDEMCRIGNPMGGRLWVTVGLPFIPGILLGVVNDLCSVQYPDNRHGLPLTADIRLATPEELQAAGINPREAGVKEIV